MINRVYHPWWKWECYKAGFYNTTIDLEDDTAKTLYKTFLQDLRAFASGMDRVMKEWPNSCEHFLTNASMNRIAWLGQAAMCISKGIPSKFRGGFKLLTDEEQKAANSLAQVYLEKWEKDHENQKLNS